MTHSNYALLLDSGNTRLKIACFDMGNQKLLDNVFAVEHKDISKAALKVFFDGLSLQLCTQNQGSISFIKSIGVNVAGTAKAQHIENIIYQLTNTKHQWISVSASQAGVFNHYANINKLGVDRWLAMVGLSKLNQQKHNPLVLASFGTATTIDTLVPHNLFVQTCKHRPELQKQWPKSFNTDNGLDNIDWHFVGGTILPGPSLMAQSLASNTANLPNAIGETQSFPLETFQAISSGIAGAQTGAVIRQWQAAFDTFKVQPALYISGGGAHIIKSELMLAIKKAQDLNNFKPCAAVELSAPVMYGLATFLFD